MNAPLTYRDFLDAKVPMALEGGFEVALADINPLLKPHQKLMVQWACRGGRRAIFAAFGLGKSVIQLEILRLVKLHIRRAVLQVAPLGVRLELIGDAEFLMTGDRADVTDAQRAELVAWLDGRPDRRIDLRFIRRTVEAKGMGHYLTNFESIREGKIDPAAFGAASLDEASCLRGMGGTKTFREFMRLFDGTAYKFVATATPSPNDYIELLAYSAFLEVMDIGQAKTRFFKRNSEKADQLTIHPHKEREFWLWVASWGLFVTRPSDLGCSDEGYALPRLTVHWHELPSNHLTAGEEKSGQKRLLKNAAASLQDAAREKRESIGARVGKMMELRALDPAAHRVIWHDLEAERHAIERAIGKSDGEGRVKSVWGSQDLDEREKRLADFAYGRLAELSTKPIIAGQGSNFQRFCRWEIFVGIGHKFNDLIQAIHRCYRFLQQHEVRIDLIYTEAERPIRDAIEAKWHRHDQQRDIMTGIIRQYGLSAVAMAATLTRGMGVERVEVVGNETIPSETRVGAPDFHLVNNDCVEEVRLMADNSVDLIVTSIPFSTQYEYSPNYADFGHTDDNAHFWQQMDFLIPQLLRVLAPGRDAVIHVKDRITPGGVNGLGFQTLEPFSDECVARFKAHGWAFLSRVTVTTDVVRENNQTYRLGWTEQCKDGSRMGHGVPEYCLVFRKPPSDLSNGYADKPVRKAKKGWERGSETVGSSSGSGPGQPPGHWDNPEGYSRGRWQLDAHGFWKSDGNRLLTPEELRALDANVIYKVWKATDLGAVYDYEHHVYLAEGLEAASALPSDFMLLPPHSSHPDVWTDVARMLSMNTLQAQQGREAHLCPLQFDIIDRVIIGRSEPGEVVFDPFGGVMSVPYRALKHGRKGRAVELNPAYFRDGCAHVARMAEELATPDLFGVIGIEEAA
jgi:DNA modification methylase